MSALMDRLKIEEDKLNQGQEDSHGEYAKMKAVFEKRFQLYLKYLTEDDLTDLDKLRLENKKEWQMAHLLELIEHEDITNKISDI
jgi:hypothetical protein